MQQNTMIAGTINLTQLKEYLDKHPEKVFKSEKGNLYLGIVISPKREADKFGQDVSISLSKTKEERDAKADTMWIGSGKTMDFEPSIQPATADDVRGALGDLPF